MNGGKGEKREMLRVQLSALFASHAPGIERMTPEHRFPLLLRRRDEDAVASQRRPRDASRSGGEEKGCSTR